MAKRTQTTKDLVGRRVVGGKKRTRRIGKVRSCVFHPSEKRVIGIIVKRPDFLWMFHRKDKFVSCEGYEMEDGRVVLLDDASKTDNAACKSLGVKWDDCVLWVGMPIRSVSGTSYGFVESVTFSEATGLIESLETGAGVTADALLGKRTIPAEYVKGFKRGVGEALALTDEDGNVSAEKELGAILVSDEVANLNAEGGLAEQAGKATAVVVDKVQTSVDKVKPAASKAAKATGEAINKGAYVTGRQVGRTKGMFAAFKDEYNKARHDD